jgi:hypothetical protein
MTKETEKVLHDIIVPSNKLIGLQFNKNEVLMLYKIIEHLNKVYTVLKDKLEKLEKIESK